MRPLLVLGLVACSSKAQGPAPVPPPTVHVDRRIELIGIVERLAGEREYRMAPGMAYVADIDRQFGPFASHPAVALTRALHDQHGIAYDAPMMLAVQLDDQLRPRGDVAALDARWQGVDVAAYAAQLRAFAEASRLDDFLAAHRAYYAAVEQRFQHALDVEQPATWFRDFFGGAGARFVVVPGLLEGPENYGVRTTAGGALEMYQVMGVDAPDAGGLPTVGEDTLELVVHEMAHSFVNPLFERHLGELLPAGEAIYPLVARPMRDQAYGTAETMLLESGVRAVTVLYVRDRKGPQAGADATRRELRRSFVWTGELADLLDRYRRDRVRYRELDAFMPEIAAFFAAKARAYEHGLPPQPFLGPVNAVIEGVIEQPGAVIAPAGAEAALAGYVARIHGEVFAAAPLVVASEHTLAELPHVGLVAYGSPGTNPVVAHAAAAAGWAITDAGVTIAGRSFPGADLAVIACWPRADDPRHGIAIYAAAHDATLVGINSLRHGSTDWLVARRRADGAFEVVASGDFPRAADGAWLAR